jgi:predicted TIM-barrel fold metal-dependent hydrolase
LLVDEEDTVSTAHLAPQRPARRERAGIVDCDVHNATRSPDDLKPYLASRWHREYAHGPHIGGHGGQVQGARPQRDIFRRDSMPETGIPGCDVGLMQEQLMDRYNVVKAVLHPVLEVLRAPSYGPLGHAVTRAINEWMVEHWLTADPRFFGAISVPVEDGPAAAEEIERAAASSNRFVKVMLPMVTREGFGHPKYWPIYEAATAHGLPVAAHVGGFSGTHTATGWPTYFVEQHTGYAQNYQAQIVSLIGAGVFERFPTLEIVLEEGGIAWMPPLMWRLDRMWEALGEHAPTAIVRRPSEVIRKHIAFTTQPFDEPEKPKMLAQLLEQLDMNDRIMFSSDYPHWDFDDPDRVLSGSAMSPELRAKIGSENALRLIPFPEDA